MRSRIPPFLILGILVANLGFAQDNIASRDRMIGQTIKILAKSFIQVADIEKIKKEGIGKIRKMDDDKYKRRYDKVYEVLKSLPENFLVKNGIAATMTKSDCLRKIGSLDKQKLYKIIDSIPDSFIAYRLSEYFKNKKEKLPNSSVVGQIGDFWDRIMSSLRGR